MIKRTVPTDPELPDGPAAAEEQRGVGKGGVQAAYPRPLPREGEL